MNKIFTTSQNQSFYSLLLGVFNSWEFFAQLFLEIHLLVQREATMASFTSSSTDLKPQKGLPLLLVFQTSLMEYTIEAKIPHRA